MVAELTGLTLEEFLRLPEAEPPLEYADGVVTRKVSARGRDAILQAELVERLNQAGRPRKVARALTEIRATYDNVSRVPDIAVYRWERIPVDDQGRPMDDFFVAPDIAIEIVSPQQGCTSLVRRCLWFVAHGVQIALLVDPDDESVLAFRPNEPPVALRGSDSIDLTEVLPDFSLTVEQLFGFLQM